MFLPGALASAIAAIAAILCIAAAPAQAAPGDLDPSFGSGGWVRTLEVDVGDQNYLPHGASGVALQPDGKIVAVGDLQDGISNNYFGAFRYLPDGRLDSSFGTGGVVAADIGTFEAARAVAIQPDGKIVVAGVTDCTNGLCFAAMRFNPDGSVDAGFGTGGVFRKEFSRQPSFGNAVAIQPDGRIVLAGARHHNGRDAEDDLAVCVLRLLPDGRLDPSFSRDGAALLDYGYGNDTAQAVTLQRGRIVVAGQGRDTSLAARFGIARFRQDGRLDHSFGHRGQQLVSFGRERLATAYSIATTSHGGLAVAGSAVIKGHAPEAAVTRLTPNGALDRSFGKSGRVRTAPGPYGGYALAVTASMSGGLLVAGRAFGDTTRDGSDWALMSYSAGGQLDNTFGDHGIVRTQFGTGRDQASALALTPGRAIAVGAIYDSLGVGRYLTR